VAGSGGRPPPIGRQTAAASRIDGDGHRRRCAQLSVARGQAQDVSAGGRKGGGRAPGVGRSEGDRTGAAVLGPGDRDRAGRIGQAVVRDRAGQIGSGGQGNGLGSARVDPWSLVGRRRAERDSRIDAEIQECPVHLSEQGGKVGRAGGVALRVGGHRRRIRPVGVAFAQSVACPSRTNAAHARPAPATVNTKTISSAVPGCRRKP